MRKKSNIFYKISAFLLAASLLSAGFSDSAVAQEKTVDETATQSEQNKFWEKTYVEDQDIWIGSNLKVSKSIARYYDGTSSIFLRKENAKETATAVNNRKYKIEKDATTTDFTLTWEAWYQSKNSQGFLRVNITSYDANKKKIATHYGNEVMLSRNESASEWMKISTSEVVSAETAYVSFAVSISEGYDYVWVDGLSVSMTANYEDTIAERYDFHTMTSTDRVPDWDVREGTLRVEGGMGIFTPEKMGSISYATKALTPGCEYELRSSYLAASDVEFRIIYQDIQGNTVDEEKMHLPAVDQMTELSLTTKAADAVLAVVSFESDGVLKLSDLVFYYNTDEASGSHGWKANVVWYPEDPKVEAIGQARYFRSTFQIEKEVEKVYLQCAADDDTWGNIYLNSTTKKIGTTQVEKLSGNDKQTAYIYDLTDRIVQGRNVLAMRVHNVNSTAGLIFEIYITYKDGTCDTVYSDRSNVKVSRLGCLETDDFFNKTQAELENPADWFCVSFDDSSWVNARNLGVPPYAEMRTPNYIYGYTPCYTILADSVKTESVVAGKSHTTCRSYTKESYVDQKPEQVTGLLEQNDTVVAHLTIDTVFKNGNAQFTYIIPDYLQQGEYTLALQEDELCITDGDGNRDLCRVSLTEPEKTTGTGRVEKEDGVVRLYVNDEKTSPILYLRPHHNVYYDYDTLKGVAESGIGLYCTYNGQLNGKDGNLIWQGRDEEGQDRIDYDLFDREIYKTLDLQKNAMMLVNISMDAPQWWLLENPDECLSDENGTPITFSDAEQPLRVSYGSKKYRQESGKVLKKLIQHMQQAPYRNRVCGVRLTGGHTYEWKQYNQDDEGSTVKWLAIDYSKAMKDSFREDTGYEVPTVEKRCRSSYSTILDPKTQSSVIAFNEYLSQCVTDTFLGYAQTVKELQSDWLVGGYYGYLWFESSSLGIGGCHTTVEQVLDSPYVDFISSPVNYSERIAGYQTGYMAMSESVAAHGKLYILEQDNRTPDGHVFGNAKSDNAVGLETTTEGSVNQLLRDMTRDFVQGNGFWLFDMEGGWFDKAAVKDAIRTIKTEYDRSLDADLSSDSQVAVYVGADFYSQLTADTLGGGNASMSTYLISQLYNKQRLELSKMGTSYDTYMMEDLCSDRVDVDFDRYRLHIILSPIAMDQDMRDAVSEKLKKNGNTILWIYLPGVSDGESISAENLSDVIDMDVTLMNGIPLNLTGQITDSSFGNVNETYGMDYGYTYQTPYAVVTDEQSVQLAVYDNETGIAAAKKDCGTYTSVFSGIPCVKADSLRAICVDAGVHLYTTDKNTVVDSNQSYLSIYSQCAGKKEISLSGTYDVYDVYAGCAVAQSVTKFVADTKSGETKLYRLTECKGEDQKEPEHQHKPVKKVTKKATFTQNGQIQTVCETCHAVLSEEIIPRVSVCSLNKKSLTYNKKTQSVRVTIKDEKGQIIPESAYTLTGNQRKNPGIWKVVVTFKKGAEKYAGSKMLQFVIRPKGTTLSSVTRKKNKMTVRWKKQTSQSDGYKIQYSTDKNFKKNVKTVTVKKNQTTVKTVKNLKVKKTYYVRICTYKGNTVSSWSSVKKVK